MRTKFSMCVTLDEDCLLPPVQSLNRLVKRYTARILHLCRLNSKNRRGLSPALIGDRGSASSLESLKGFAHTSLLRGTKRGQRLFRSCHPAVKSPAASSHVSVSLFLSESRNWLMSELFLTGYLVFSPVTRKS